MSKKVDTNLGWWRCHKSKGLKIYLLLNPDGSEELALIETPDGQMAKTSRKRLIQILTEKVTPPL